MSDKNRRTPFLTVVRSPKSLPALDPSLERWLRLERLQRLIRKRASGLACALGHEPAVWLQWAELEKLLDLYRTRRELAYFEMGFDQGAEAERLLGVLRGMKREGVVATAAATATATAEEDDGAALRGAGVRAMLARWEAEDVADEPAWDVDDIERVRFGGHRTEEGDGK